MPNQPQLPIPADITPALLKTHSITPDEYALIEQKLGRTPSLTELGIFSVMWSEHCSYKSSRVHLKRLPTKGTRTSGPGAVLQGPGENAGIIDVGDGWACAFKIESHNHPSYIEPYQGAATGVGGILRDIFTMGARPLAVMDSLRFGPLQPSPNPVNKPGAPGLASETWDGSAPNSTPATPPAPEGQGFSPVQPSPNPANKPGAPGLASETWDGSTPNSTPNSTPATPPAPEGQGFNPLQPSPNPANKPGAPGLASETWDGSAPNSTPATPPAPDGQGFSPPTTLPAADGASAPEGTIDYARNRQTMRGVVHGVGGYGNCFGVPNLGGETRFEDCYSGNPLLNAFALGLVRTDEIFYARAEGVGNPVFYVGAKTGRDGIHGATMASEEFTAGSEQKRPNVQMGDPFLEKLLLEACLEVMKTGAVLGIQDMGAAGLTCSTCEMGARGSLGVTIELDRVPQRETGMTSYEIMLSESQERMLLVAEKGREHEVLAVFEKWGLDCAEVGTVTADDVMRVFHAGTLVAEIPNKALTDEAPVYHRPVGTWTAPVPRDPPAWVLEELKKPRDYTADLLKLLASPNICSKHWVYEQYDSMVQTNTVQGPGGEAGVLRIKRTGTAAPSTGGTHTKGVPHHREGEADALVGGIPSAADPTLQEQPGAPSFESHPKGGVSSEARPPSPDFLSFSGQAAQGEGQSATEADHSLLGRIVNFIAGSTPEAEAVLLTGNLDAANPDIAPGPDHLTGQPGSAAVSPVEEPGAPPLASERWEEAPPTSAATTVPFPPSLAPFAKGGVPSSTHPPRPERGIAMALAGNGRWCYLDPKLGAMHAVAEAARKVACTGATPVAATNCLNFGNPQKPEIMAQFSQVIDGIAEACTALGTPITGGNVSLYNETLGEGIYPTPVIGVVGLLDDVTKAVPSAFQQVGDIIIEVGDRDETHPTLDQMRQRYHRRLGTGEFARVCLGHFWGEQITPNLKGEAEVNSLLSELASAGIVTTAMDIGSGGLAVVVARAAMRSGIGATIDPMIAVHDPGSIEDRSPDRLDALSVFMEKSSVVLTCHPANESAVYQMAAKRDLIANKIGFTGGAKLSIVAMHGDPFIEASLSQLQAAFSTSLELQLTEEMHP